MSIFRTCRIDTKCNIMKVKLNCGECGKFPITNAHFKLCTSCNKKRLGEKKSPIKKELRKSVVKSSSRTNDKIKADELFYKECFDVSNHLCEECETQLPTSFSENGKVLARWRYSHIIPKSIAPNLRHTIDNINHLCLECHQKWENGLKKEMLIYKGNQKRFPQYLK